MQVRVEFAAQLKRAAGHAEESVQLANNATLRELAVQLAEQHGVPFRQMILTESNELSGTVLVFSNEKQVRDPAYRLSEGETLTFLTPISGG